MARSDRPTVISPELVEAYRRVQRDIPIPELFDAPIVSPSASLAALQQAARDVKSEILAAPPVGEGFSDGSRVVAYSLLI